MRSAGRIACVLPFPACVRAPIDGALDSRYSIHALIPSVRRYASTLIALGVAAAACAALGWRAVARGSQLFVRVWAALLVMVRPLAAVGGGSCGDVGCVCQHVTRVVLWRVGPGGSAAVDVGCCVFLWASLLRV